MRPWDRWWWAAFVVALDRAGFRIVRKPTLTRFGPK
jgi:hypothetical protein